MMADNKKSVLLYCDIIHTVKNLTNEEAGKLFKHYLEYINDLNPNPPDKLTQIVFEPIKQNLKRDLKKWQLKSEKNSKIAKEGWEKRKYANAYERKKVDANDADKDKDKDKDIVKDIFNFKNKLIDYGFEESLVNDWIKVREKKKAANTETAYKMFITEIKKRNCNLNEVLTTIVSNSWQGFKWEWIDNFNKSKGEQPKVMIR